MPWRVGLVVPSFNTVMEVDLYRSLPRDSTLHAARVRAEADDLEAEARLLDEDVASAAGALATAHPHIVVFGCTSAELVGGSERDRGICDRLEAASGAVVVSSAAAVGHALRETRASSVAVVTPYGDAVNRRIREGLEYDGIEVSALHGMGLTEPDIGVVTPEAIYSFVQARLGPRVPGEALFLAGTNWQALSTLSLLKISYDVPMVTSNLAALQAVKRTIDILRQRELAPPAVIG